MQKRNVEDKKGVILMPDVGLVLGWNNNVWYDMIYEAKDNAFGK